MTNQMTTPYDTYWIPSHVEIASDGVFLHTFDGDYIVKIKGDPSRIIREGKHRLAYIRWNDGNLEVDPVPSTEVLKSEDYTLAVEYWGELMEELR